MINKKPLVLIILDGWGLALDSDYNAISLAHKPFWDRLQVAYPHTSLSASGEDVGLPKGEAGNSEVGHLNIGAGMIVYQELPRINMAISDGSFLENKALLAAANSAKKNNKKFHVMGLVGRGNVHSSLEHLYALLWFAKVQGLKDVYLHLFTDGRDSLSTSGLGIIKEILEKCTEIGIGKIASVCGRYWAMDRDNRWQRTSKAYDALTQRIGKKITDPLKTINDLYQKNITDEFIEPFLVTDKDGGLNPVGDGDSVVFYNFRPDRVRQLTRAFIEPILPDFPRKLFLKNLIFVTMTEYEKGLPAQTAFPPPNISYPLSAILSAHHLRQLHIGETEKYAHVTYFLNGGREDPYTGEDRVHIPSPKVATYDQKPEMSAPEITDYVCSSLRQKLYDFYVVNYANADMVAHTGRLDQTISAIEVLDISIKKVTDLVLGEGGTVVITADHGNAESTVDPITGKADTEHSTNPVPFVVIADSFKTSQSLQLPSGILADVAPTILSLMGLVIPSTMTGRNLLPQ